MRVTASEDLISESKSLLFKVTEVALKGKMALLKLDRVETNSNGMYF
jgi:hypothetical protein